MAGDTGEFTCKGRNWLTGTRHLSLAARGLYWDLICLQRDLGGPIPNTPKFLRAHLGDVDRHARRKALAELVEAGKIELLGDGKLLSNPRTAEDLAIVTAEPASAGDNTAIHDENRAQYRSATTGEPFCAQPADPSRARAILCEGKNKNLRKEDSQQEQQQRSLGTARASSAESAAAAALARRIFDEVLGKEAEAVIFGIGRCRAWLAAEYDPDLVILPVIRARTQANRAREPGWIPRGLEYFDKALADEHARATQPVTASPGVISFKSRTTIQAEKDALFAEWARNGIPSDDELLSVRSQ